MCRRELLRDLESGVTASHDKSCPRGNVTRSAVPRRVRLEHTRRKTLRDIRDEWRLEGAGGDDDLAGKNGRARDVEPEANAVCLQAADR